MKKKMKQFLAAMMAVAMVLSLCVTAGATEQTLIQSGDATYTVTSADNVTKLPMSGGFEGNSRSEGALPEDPVEVVFPTIPANPGRDDGVSTYSADKFGVFDIILDPHGLINATDGARYVKTGVTKSFSDSRLYFLKNFTDTFQRYDGESYPLKISNKGRQPINIDLNLDFEYDDTKISLVDDRASIVTGDSSQAAQMYFGLKFGSVVTGDTTITGDTVVSGGAGSTESPKPVKPVAEEDAAPTVKVSGKGDYIKDGAVTFDWSVQSGAAYDALNKDLSKVQIKLSYLKATPIMSGDNAQQGTIKVEPTVPTGYGYTITGDIISGDEVTGEGTVTVSIKSGDNTSDIATVAIGVVAPSVLTMKSGDDYKQVIQFKAATTGAVVQVTLDGNENAYKKQWTDPAGHDVDDPETQGITTTGYYYKLKDDVTKFPTLAFSLEGDINDNNIWDSVDTRNTGVSFTLIWDVMQHSTYYGSIASGGQLEEAGPPAPKAGNAPTITVATKATSSKQLVLNVSAGTEDYVGYAPKAVNNVVTLTLSDGKTIPMSYASNKLTATGTASTNNANISGNTITGTVVFSKEGFKDITVTTPAGLK
jgi:hypothetical protein